VADVTAFKMELEEVPEDDPRTLAVKPDAMKFQRGSFQLELKNFQNADGSEMCSCMGDLLNEQVEQLIRNEYARVWHGDKESLVHLPVESLLPILLLKNLASFSTSLDIA
jgi:hypothetical protein